MSLSRSSSTSESTKRQQIVATAYRLFKANGFFATGVDLIMREAGVSKRTLYQYFPSKNDLVLACLNHYHEQQRQQIEQLIDRQNRSARANLLAIFEYTKTGFEDAHFHGCLASNAMAEFSGKDHAIEFACLRFKQWEIELLRELAFQLDAAHADSIAYQLFVVLEGAVSIAHVVKGVYPIDIAMMAEAIMNNASPGHANSDRLAEKTTSA